MVFSDASTYTCIINLKYNNSEIKFREIKPNEILNPFEFEISNYDSLSQHKWNLKSKIIEKLFKKINSNPWTVNDVFSAIRTGVDTGTDDIFILKGKLAGDKFNGYSERLKKDIILESGIVKPMLKGGDVRKYAEPKNEFFVIYPHFSNDNKTTPYEELFFEQNFPLTFDYLFEFKEELTKKKIHKRTNPKYWYSLHRSRDKSIFEQLKIVTPETSLGGNLTIDYNNYYHNTQVYSLIKNIEIEEDIKFWLSILNSSVFWYYLQQTGAVLRGGYFRFKTKYLEPFPLPKLENLDFQQPYVEKVDFSIAKTKVFNEILNKFQNYLLSQFPIEKLTKKLQNWHELDFGEFIKELNKAIAKENRERRKKEQEEIPKLSKKDEFEWMELFEDNKKKAVELQTQIDQLDHQIDQMVYELYGLTEEEISIVENA